MWNFEGYQKAYRGFKRSYGYRRSMNIESIAKAKATTGLIKRILV